MTLVRDTNCQRLDELPHHGEQDHQCKRTFLFLEFVARMETIESARDPR